MEILKNRMAIISGGAGDIGSAIALELAGRGSDVAIGDLQEPNEVLRLLNTIQDKGVRTMYTQLDVSHADAVRDWVRNVESILGIPDIIIPCAGQVTLKDAETISAAEWEREIQVNLNGAFYLAQACAVLLLKEHLPGNIIFIGSFAGLIPQVHNIAYSVSKAGVHALTKGMALEFGQEGITINAIAPGNVYAGMSRRYYEDHPSDVSNDTQIIPTRRLVYAEEVAWHAANLCDPRSQNINGVVLPIDGGMSVLPDFRSYRK